MEYGVIDSLFRIEHKELEDEVFKTSMQNSVPTLNDSNSGQVGVVDVELKFVETPLINNEDSTIEVTLKDDSNADENKDEELEDEMIPYIPIEDISSYQYIDRHYVIKASKKQCYRYQKIKCCLEQICRCPETVHSCHLKSLTQASSVAKIHLGISGTEYIP